LRLGQLRLDLAQLFFTDRFPPVGIENPGSASVVLQLALGPLQIVPHVMEPAVQPGDGPFGSGPPCLHRVRDELRCQRIQKFGWGLTVGGCVRKLDQTALGGRFHLEVRPRDLQRLLLRCLRSLGRHVQRLTDDQRTGIRESAQKPFDIQLASDPLRGRFDLREIIRVRVEVQPLHNPGKELVALQHLYLHLHKTIGRNRRGARHGIHVAGVHEVLIQLLHFQLQIRPICRLLLEGVRGSGDDCDCNTADQTVFELPQDPEMIEQPIGAFFGWCIRV
jgi:hypothetical protein